MLVFNKHKKFSMKEKRKTEKKIEKGLKQFFSQFSKIK
jgi:hypothetical protein